jgi:hypothetical protein
MPPPNGPDGRRGRPLSRKTPPTDPTEASVTPSADIGAACEAFVVLLITPAGKYRRRVFLSLHSAAAAVQRAKDKGQPVRMVLCRLVPVAPDLDLDGEVAS